MNSPTPRIQNRKASSSSRQPDAASRRQYQEEEAAKNRLLHEKVQAVPQFSDQSPQLFESVLEQPLYLWNPMEDAMVKYAPQWTPAQRSKLIASLIQFLELKVLLQDYSAEPILAPTCLIGRAWYAIALKQQLYTSLENWIQDFHQQQHKAIHRPLLTLKQEDDGRHVQKVERTQRLFVCYYLQSMPETLREIDMAWRNQNAFDHRVVQEQDDCDSGSDFDDDDDESSVLSNISRNSISCVNAFTSWLTCWQDPFPEAPEEQEYDQPWYSFKNKRSNDTNSTDPMTEDDESHMWIVFDHDKKREQEDAMTFLTMDDQFDASTTATNERREQLPRKQRRKQQRPPPPEQQVPILEDEQDQDQQVQQQSQQNEDPKGWEMLKTKFRIAAMIMQELE